MMQLDHLTGKHVLVVGLGESGLAMVRFCLRSGAASVAVCDTRDLPPQLNALKQDYPNVKFTSGNLDAQLLEGIDILGWSPGLSPTSPAAVSFVKAANDAGIKLSGEIELFAVAMSELQTRFGYQPSVIAITGTNGKTTTTQLTAHLCKSAGKRCAVAGNVSPAALDVLCAALDTDDMPEVWVLELSSFQLALADSFAPSASTILNISQDHLDWHTDMADYVRAKQTIYARSQWTIENRDDAATHAPVAPISTKKMSATELAAVQAQIIPSTSFGLSEPTNIGDFGVVQLNGLKWLVQAIAADDEPIVKKKQALAREMRINALMPVDTLKIKGAHNWANALAALSLCHAIGLRLNKALYGCKTYSGEAHRFELIATINNIEYYDDGKGTNVGATVAALSGMGKPVVLIAGGDGKGQDFAPLATAVARYARAVVLIGRDGPTIKQAIARAAHDADVVIHECDSLSQATERASELAQAGDAVMLSPACASFDQFKNYVHRSQVFLQAVEALKAKVLIAFSVEAQPETTHEQPIQKGPSA
jgi:UDP-N-acetylmuramoylalanine--D-glutamate ligase